MAKYNEPGLENKEAVDIIDKHTSTAKSQVSNTAEEGKEKTRKERDEVINTDGQKLNPQEDQKDNFAKTGGSKGSLTGKDFTNTLNLMRRADKYNNKPVSEMFSVGTRHTGGVKNLGTGYERPKIETEEMREMERNRSLDLQQKQLMVELQHAINSKDVEAFKDAYKQIFGITLSTTQAIQTMQNWSQQQQITNTATKDVASWQKKFVRAFDMETLEYLTALSQKDEQLATLITNAMYGLPTPNLDERILMQTVNNLADQYVTQDNMSPLRARLKASNVVNYVLLENDNTTASSDKRSQNIRNQVKGYSTAKDVAKESKEL